MKTFLFDLDDTILNLNWDETSKVHYGSLAEYHAKTMPKEEVVKYVFLSYRYMVEVVDERTNKNRFYDKMAELSGVDKDILLASEDGFYMNEFDRIKELTAPMEDMVKAVRSLYEKGFSLVLATNPVFPDLAVKKRIVWAGLEEKMFKKITYFESSKACKPNKEYYQQLIDELKLVPSECVMVGNDRKEDMMAAEFGMEAILITDRVIESDDEFQCREMTAREFLDYVENLEV